MREESLRGQSPQYRQPKNLVITSETPNFSLIRPMCCNQIYYISHVAIHYEI